MDDEMLFRRRAALEALITDREGMLVMNAERVRNGNAPAYGEEAFFSLANQMRGLVNY